ncbi:hypothetical protein B0H16DRAFT_1740898 [Mycena metata]|uniref:Uncharacterized protein n=1 Tax=Mycena metata TaxID=1033252 RepID=A0AAD7HCV7_9AGAR|nr:hypothetical protein B0H16DRAFT_1740898 [Mycena metata]
MSSPDATTDKWGIKPVDGFNDSWELLKGMNADQAGEEITCMFLTAKMVYVQLVRFAPHAHRWNHSPKAIQAVWDPSLATPENPDTPGWVELAKTQEETPPFKINIVALDYAAGRIARLARSSWNAIISNDLLQWAEYVSPLSHSNFVSGRIEHPWLPPIHGATEGRYAVLVDGDESDAEYS